MTTPGADANRNRRPDSDRNRNQASASERWGPVFEASRHVLGLGHVWASGLNGYPASQADLAARVGVSQPTIHRIEAGQREPTVAALVGLASALGCGLDDLLRGARAAASTLPGQAVDLGRVRRAVLGSE